DLALKIDITDSSLNRMAIDAALRVPEVWRWDGKTLVCYLLGPDGRYTVSTVSRAIPGLVVSDLAPFLSRQGQMDENAIVRRFRAWGHQHLGATGSGQSSP